MVENNQTNRQSLALAQFNNMDMDALQDFVIEHYNSLYERNDVAFQDDWDFNMIPE